MKIVKALNAVPLFVGAAFFLGLYACASEKQGAEASNKNLDSVLLVDTFDVPVNSEKQMANAVEKQSATVNDLPLKRVKLVPATQRSFDLDENSSLFSYCVQYKVMDGNPYLFVINDLTNTLYVHNYSTGEIFKKIRLMAEGPNGTGQQVRSFTVHSWDSIFVMSMWESKISLIDSTGKRKDSFLAHDVNNDLSISPSGGTIRPMIFHAKGNQRILTFTGFYPYNLKNSKEKAYALAVVNIKDKTLSGKFRYPQTNFNGFYGNNGAYLEYAFNPEKNLVIINSRVSDSLLVGNIVSGKSTRFYAKSSHTKSIPPLNDDRFASLENSAINKYDMEQPYYGAVIYDLANKLYYRILVDGSQDPFRPTFEIVILNESFQIIGEQQLPHKVYNPRMFFVNSEGVFFVREDLYKKDENHAIFELLKPEPEL